MKTNFFSLLIIISIYSCNKDETTLPGQNAHSGYTLVWSDEFDQPSIDTNNWTYELGDGTDYGLKSGWGNEELQLYTDSKDNSYIKSDEQDNSVLAIVAMDHGDGGYSSAKLTTNDLQNFLYGRIEARVKLPFGQGIWPAFWLLGESHETVGWPGSGEIDVFEVIGHETNIVHSSAHWVNSDLKKGTSTEYIDTGINLETDYHTYRLDWTPEELVFYVEEIEVNRVSIDSDMKEFLRPAYLILNIAVGGNWPGSPDETTQFPQEMLVDWIRYYSMDGFEAPESPALDPDEETLGIVYDEFAVHAINESSDQFPNIGLKIYGDGGEPAISSSNDAIYGDTSLSLNFTGESWGGAFFQFDEEFLDFSAYAQSNLVFSLKKPESIADFEIKLESAEADGKLYIVNYTGTDIGNGFKEYSIPLQEFVDQGLDLSQMFIPFAIWNPINSDGEWQGGEVLVDNIYFD
ncbi:MAG: family 16 glycosylhydrolase [Flavobacteriaceae bacterium]|jgi:beta-glucanase (GH16 family)